MARTSKKTEVKATETAIKSKAEDIKAENKTAESKVAADKATEGTAAQEKPAEKTTARKASEKTEAAKTPAKKETAKSKAAAVKAETACTLSIQYGGRELSGEGLIRTAREIWENDLQRKAEDLSSMELYLKPEENKVYYVMNKDVTGSFDI